MATPIDTPTRRRAPAAPWFAAALALAVAVPGAARAAEQQIGAAAIVVNNVTGMLATTRESAALRAGIDVFQNEVITTADESASRVVFQDKTELSIGAQSEVVLDRFVFDPDPSRSQVAVSLTKGVIRFSTGLLPKENYAIRTPSAQIGIRGTVLTLTVSGNKSTTASVHSGISFVTAQGVTVTVNAGFSTLVRPGMPPTPPVPSPPPPQAATRMLALLEGGAARASDIGTRVGSRASAVEIPQQGGNMMVSPNIDPKIQAEISGDKTPPLPPGQQDQGGSSGSRGTHGTSGSAGSRGTHGGT